MKLLEVLKKPWMIWGIIGGGGALISVKILVVVDIGAGPLFIRLLETMPAGLTA